MNEIGTAEAAAALGVNTSRICQLITAGRLKARKLGKRVWLIRPEDLDAVRVRKPGRPWHKEAGRGKA